MVEDLANCGMKNFDKRLFKKSNKHAMEVCTREGGR